VYTDQGEKAIETFEGGERVLARHEKTGEIAFKRVTRTYASQRKEIFRVVIADEHGQQETLRTTAEHPFWIKDSGWRKAGLLSAGDLLVNHCNQSLSVVSAGPEDAIETVYNIEVEDFHTYHAGQLGVWVHNTCDNNCSLFTVAELHKRITGEDMSTYEVAMRTGNMDGPAVGPEAVSQMFQTMQISSGNQRFFTDPVLADRYMRTHNAELFGLGYSNGQEVGHILVARRQGSDLALIDRQARFRGQWNRPNIPMEPGYTYHVFPIDPDPAVELAGRFAGMHIDPIAELADQFARMDINSW
jgi:hypothetical protein